MLQGEGRQAVHEWKSFVDFFVTRIGDNHHDRACMILETSKQTYPPDKVNAS